MDMPMDFDVNKVLQYRLASSLGLDKYQSIIHQIRKTDVSKDTDFQTTFNGFYRVRRNAEWRNIYYTHFEEVKTGTPTFASILTHMYQHTGNIEASFSSKMLASIFPDKPIWDSYIVQLLDMKLVGATQQEKLENAIALYADMELWYEQFMQTDKAHECIEAFDRLLPDYQWMSSVKKLDCILWSIR